MQYELLSEALHKHLSFSKMLMKYAERNGEIIREIADTSGVSPTFKTFANDFEELLVKLEEFIEEFKIILKPYSDKKRDQEE